MIFRRKLPAARAHRGALESTYVAKGGRSHTVTGVRNRTFAGDGVHSPASQWGVGARHRLRPAPLPANSRSPGGSLPG